jgi:DNA-binding XRE family transcriptional regulator
MKKQNEAKNRLQRKNKANSDTNDLKTLDQFIDETYGPEDNKKRKQFEKGFEIFKVGFLLQQARIKKGLTQEALAKKCETNKGYISKIENDIKEVRISTLQKIVEKGLNVENPRKLTP